MDYEELTRAISAMDRLSKLDIPMVLDGDDAILGEYDRYLGRNSVGRKLFASRQNRGLITYHSGRPSNRCTEKLGAVRFDKDDVVYIGTAQSCAKGFFLTTEVKHRSEPWRSALLDDCGVIPGDLEDLEVLLTI